MYASDERIRVRRIPGKHYLPECIRPQHTGTTSDFMVWVAISYNSLSNLVLLQGKINSASYIAEVVRVERDNPTRKDNAAHIVSHELETLRFV